MRKNRGVHIGLAFCMNEYIMYIDCMRPCMCVYIFVLSQLAEETIRKPIKWTEQRLRRLYVHECVCMHVMFGCGCWF